ncbi:hypothetical protein [Arthrobacter silvisoli]|uniref:hypothetical protein n=1 Tax=Arthrobacter silvisoli TaxID=2291022 RepID=UPI000E20EA38|nr:hypothetical protein [Arthrobacter silvisoli]
MSKARVKRFAVVRPIGTKPFPERPELCYRDNRELTEQLGNFAKQKWPAPQQVTVDVFAEQIIVDGRVAGDYSLHEHHSGADRTEALPGVGA